MDDAFFELSRLKCSCILSSVEVYRVLTSEGVSVGAGPDQGRGESWGVRISVREGEKALKGAILSLYTTHCLNTGILYHLHY